MRSEGLLEGFKQLGSQAFFQANRSHQVSLNTASETPFYEFQFALLSPPQFPSDCILQAMTGKHVSKRLVAYLVDSTAFGSSDGLESQSSGKPNGWLTN